MLLSCDRPPYEPLRAPAAPALRTRRHRHEGVHAPRRALGLSDVRGPRSRQRLPRTPRRTNHRRHLSSSRNRHGLPARLQRHHPRRKHRAHRRLDRRVRSRRRHLHHPGVRNVRLLDILRPRSRLLESHVTDVSRQRPRSPVRLPSPSRVSRRPVAPLPRIRSSI